MTDKKQPTCWSPKCPDWPCGLTPEFSDGAHPACPPRLREIAAIERAEKAEAQLSGCGVAALGYYKGQYRVDKDAWGWSASYGDVVKLREKFEKAQEENTRLREGLERMSKKGTDMPPAWGDEASWYRQIAWELIGAATGLLLTPTDPDTPDPDKGDCPECGGEQQVKTQDACYRQCSTCGVKK
jgi:hypothetical protein